MQGSCQLHTVKHVLRNRADTHQPTVTLLLRNMVVTLHGLACSMHGVTLVLRNMYVTYPLHRLGWHRFCAAPRRPWAGAVKQE